MGLQGPRALLLRQVAIGEIPYSRPACGFDHLAVLCHREVTPRFVVRPAPEYNPWITRVNALIDNIESQEPAEIRLLLDPELIVRNSTRRHS